MSKNYSVKSYDVKDRNGRTVSKDFKITPNKAGQFVNFNTINDIYKKLSQQYDPTNIMVLGMNGVNMRTLKRLDENIDDLSWNDEDYYAKYNTNKTDKFNKYVGVQFVIKNKKKI